MTADVVLLIVGVIGVVGLFAWLEERSFGQASWRPAPGCLGSDPSPQEVAENDCFTCEYSELCRGVKPEDL